VDVGCHLMIFVALFMLMRPSALVNQEKMKKKNQLVCLLLEKIMLY